MILTVHADVIAAGEPPGERRAGRSCSWMIPHPARKISAAVVTATALSIRIQGTIRMLYQQWIRRWSANSAGIVSNNASYFEADDAYLRLRTNVCGTSMFRQESGSAAAAAIGHANL
ncbi:hypothetical protein GCM10029978_066530 [Actinoallomurus acanthiterrae]